MKKAYELDKQNILLNPTLTINKTYFINVTLNGKFIYKFEFDESVDENYACEKSLLDIQFKIVNSFCNLFYKDKKDWNNFDKKIERVVKK